MPIAIKHKGSHAELIAAAELLRLGFEVFRNVSAHGPADLVIYNPLTKVLLPLDVKSGKVKTLQSGKRVLAYSKHTSDGLRSAILVVTEEGLFWGNPSGYTEIRPDLIVTIDAVKPPIFD